MKKSVDNKKIGIIVVVSLLVVCLLLVFCVPSKAAIFPSQQEFDIFGVWGDNLLEAYVADEIRYIFTLDYPWEDVGNMMLITNTNGTNYYDGFWYFGFESFSFPYGYEVQSATIFSTIEWFIVGQTGVFGTSSIVFELYDETAGIIVGQDTFSFTNNTDLSGSLYFAASLGNEEYYGHTFSYRLIVHLRWAVNGSYASLYLGNARSTHNMIVEGNTLPPVVTDPRTPAPTQTPTPTPAPTVTLPPVLSPPPDRTLGPLPSVPAFTDTETQAFLALSNFWFQPITSWSFFPVILIALIFGSLGTLATLFSVTRKGGK